MEVEDGSEKGGHEEESIETCELVNISSGLERTGLFILASWDWKERIISVED